jgi:hypothetical protein
VDNREGVEELLWLRFFKSLLALVPPSTFEVKTVDKDTFSWHLELLAFNAAIVTLDHILGDFGLVLDLIEGPLLGLSLTGDFLLHGGEEALWVEEAGQPEGLRTLLGDPAIQLEVAIIETLHPTTKRRTEPSDFSSSGVINPRSGNTEIVH